MTGAQPLWHRFATRWPRGGRAAFVLLTGLLPWGIRRRVLRLLCGYSLSATSRIGVAWIDVARVTLEDGARIGNFSVFRRLELLELGDHAVIGSLNWVTSHAAELHEHTGQTDGSRQTSTLILGRHTAVTARHHLDCTRQIRVHDYATIGGWRSVFLTRGVEPYGADPFAAPITLGRHCFVGTNCVVLPGANLPDCCILGARSLLKPGLTEPYRACAGSPARSLRAVMPTGYFTRDRGWVA